MLGTVAGVNEVLRLRNSTLLVIEATHLPQNLSNHAHFSTDFSPIFFQLSKTGPRQGKPNESTTTVPRRSKIPAATQPRHPRHIPQAVLGKIR